jgi:hypothetical protein
MTQTQLKITIDNNHKCCITYWYLNTKVMADVPLDITGRTAHTHVGTQVMDRVVSISVSVLEICAVLPLDVKRNLMVSIKNTL